MKGHLKLGRLVRSILFPAIVTAANVPLGFIGVGLWLADDQLPGRAHAFVLGWIAVNLVLLVLYLTRRRWAPVVGRGLAAARMRLGIVDEDEEVEYLEGKAKPGAADPYLLAKQAQAFERRYRDHPEIPTRYAAAIAALVDVDPALAVSLFETYFARFQRVFEGSVQQKLARALRAKNPDMAARSLERWIEQHREPSALRCEIMQTAAQILDRDLGMHEAAAAHYRRLIEEYPASPAAEHAARRLTTYTT